MAAGFMPLGTPYISLDLRCSEAYLEDMDSITYQPIGVVHSPFSRPEGTPIQPSRSSGASGSIELLPEYTEGLSDLDGFSHLVLLFHLHLSEGFALTVKPYLDDQRRGVFATRAPRRPNPIGLSVLVIDRIDGNIIHVSNLDIIDGTPVLDIKPYVPPFDEAEDVRFGWLKGKSNYADNIRADKRFHRGQ